MMVVGEDAERMASACYDRFRGNPQCRQYRKRFGGSSGAVIVTGLGSYAVVTCLLVDM